MLLYYSEAIMVGETTTKYRLGGGVSLALSGTFLTFMTGEDL